MDTLEHMSVADLLTAAPEAIRGLRRGEYDALVASGVFDSERLELLEGQLVTMSPQDAQHSDTVTWLAEALRSQLRPGWAIRVQMPLAVSGSSEPEPDLAVVAAGRYRRAHPAAAGMVIEVTRTSRGVDLGRKPALYAAAQVPDYWVVDLQRRQVVVHTDPSADGYRQVRAVGDGLLVANVLSAIGVDVGALFAEDE